MNKLYTGTNIKLVYPAKPLHHICCGKLENKLFCTEANYTVCIFLKFESLPDLVLILLYRHQAQPLTFLSSLVKTCIVLEEGAFDDHV